MNLKRLEVSGFKSFMNPLRMDFTSGITAVLGPNGCGKTNIVDAIRWVLGEQKTRMLRNSKMENVIFNGTRLRKPLGMAEVQMTLSNEDRGLSIDFDEVTIARKLYRDGLSEYSINGELARLKDIKGLLVDSGLGSHSYSIIEREMVDSVISEKDQDKRFLLEEAAGVMRYRIQREEALRKIKHTENDLLRLTDILTELEKELRSLRYQVGKAKRYARIKEKVGAMESVQIKRSLYEMLGKLDAVREERAHHANITLADENEITVREDRLQETRIESAELERKLQDLNESRYEMSQALQRREERIAILSERITTARNRIEEDEGEIQRSVTKIGSLGDDLARYRSALDEKQERFSVSQDSLKQQDAALAEFGSKLGEVRTRLREGKQLTLDLLRENARKSGVRDHLETRLGELDQKTRKDEEKRASLEKEKRERADRLAEREGELERCRARITEIEGVIDAALGRSEKIVSVVSGCEAMESKASIALSRYQEKQEYLDRIRNEHGSGRGSFTNDSRISGILADHVKVEKKYRKAFEACLSPMLQGLMTTSREDALHCVREAKSNGGSRVQFLYPSENGNGGRRFFAHAKVLGTALDFLGGTSEIAGYLKPQLANVAVVADVETAIDVVRDDTEARVATLDGVFFDGAGRIVVGDNEDIEMTLLEYESKIDELGTGIASMQRRIERLRGRKQRLGELRSELLATVNQSKEKLTELHSELERLAAEQRIDEIERTKTLEKLGLVNLSIVETNRAIEGIRAELDAGRNAENDVGGNASTSDDFEALEAHALELERQKEALAEAAGSLRLEVATLSGEIATAQEKIANSEMLEAELNELVKTRDEDAKRCREDIASADSEIEASKGEITEYHGRVERVEKDIEQIKEAYDAVKARVDEIEKELKVLKSQRDEKKDNLQRCDLELATLETRIGNLVDRARESSGQDLQPYVGKRELFDTAEWESFDEETLAALRAKFDTIGPVNMLALDEYEEKKKRFDFLMKQKQDLDEAKDALIQAIRRINKEARRRLNETFDLVRTNFRQTFGTLFDGGESDLLFVDSDDPLEANIKIVANPKGKRLHDISSLSGGERALVALSLLFAIYLVKPSPFCVFDEVDAPLDDANIGRFVNMLESFTDRIQFIVITHNKKTMEAANHLYGVTMQEPGVSRMVSVHIGEVDRFRDKPAYKAASVQSENKTPEEVSA